MRKLLILLCLIFIIPQITACWNYKEIDNLTIVTGFAFDKADDGNYLLTVEVADMHEASKKDGVKSEIIESKGETILDAARNAISINYPKLYFGHTSCIIISQDIALEGIAPIIDYICRDAELRLNIFILISENKTAGEVLKAKAIATNLISTEIANILDEEKSLSKALPIPVYKFVNALGGEGVSGVVPSICTIAENEKIINRLCGTAIFKKDKLQGFIDENETKALSFILDEVKGGVLVIKTGNESGMDKIALEILKSNTKIKPVYEDNKISIKVSIETKVSLAEHGARGNYSDEKGRKKLKDIAEKQLKDEMESFIKKVQIEFNSDIFGFGNSVYKQIPKLWKLQKGNWDKLFRNLEVSVEPHIEIVHNGLLSQPVKMGD